MHNQTKVTQDSALATCLHYLPAVLLSNRHSHCLLQLADMTHSVLHMLQQEAAGSA
jgi:hypothetical protein